MRSPFLASGDAAYHLYDDDADGGGGGAFGGVSANGQEARLAEAYNFVADGAFAIGSASQDYICNTHTKYTPNPQSKLFNVAPHPKS